MRCEFEERQFEQYLNMELVGKRKILYVPGLLFEKTLGIDAAIFSENPKFWGLWSPYWKMLPFMRRWKPGVYLDKNFWELREEELTDGTFPKFKFNLFIQHKRPEYIKSPLGREYRYWNLPYFRYDLTTHQQIILGKLEQNVTSNAIVVYACPAFWKFQELWKFFSKRKLIENCNFVHPHKLNGHKRYTFINSGNVGKAFSEPINIESTNLLQEINRMFEVRERFENNTDFIYSLSTSIKRVVEDLEEEYRIGFQSLLEYIEIPQHELAESIINILIFTFVTDTVWGIGYK